MLKVYQSQQAADETWAYLNEDTVQKSDFVAALLVLQHLMIPSTDISDAGKQSNLNIKLH